LQLAGAIAKFFDVRPAATCLLRDRLAMESTDHGSILSKVVTT
jgi:hypothetical protein